MKKRVLYTHEYKNAKLVARTKYSLILKLGNGSILKVFDPNMIEILKKAGYDIETKILSASPLKNSPEIIVPTSAVYNENGQFYAYTMACADGISYRQYEDSEKIYSVEKL